MEATVQAASGTACRSLLAGAGRCLGTRTRFKPGNGFGLQGLARVLLNGVHAALVAPFGKRDGQPAAAGAAGAADTMGIVLRLHG